MTTETIETIKSNTTYKEVLADSFGGVLYNVENMNKYNKTSVDWIIKKWEAMSDSEKSLAGGIMKGAIGFLKGE